MGQSRTKIVRLLAAAMATEAPVVAHRKHLSYDRAHGFVIALTDDWVVLHDLDGVYLDEVVILRLDQVTKVEPMSGTYEAYVRRAVEALGVALESFPCAADVSVGGLLAAVAERADVVGVHLESRKGDWINYGTIHKIGRKRLDLQFVGRDGDWMDFVEAWKLEDITRIGFGGRYIRALERFSGPRPPVTSRRKR